MCDDDKASSPWSVEERETEYEVECERKKKRKPKPKATRKGVNLSRTELNYLIDAIPEYIRSFGDCPWPHIDFSGDERNLRTLRKKLIVARAELKEPKY